MRGELSTIENKSESERRNRRSSTARRGDGTARSGVLLTTADQTTWCTSSGGSIKCRRGRSSARYAESDGAPARSSASVQERLDLGISSAQITKCWGAAARVPVLMVEIENRFVFYRNGGSRGKIDERCCRRIASRRASARCRRRRLADGALDHQRVQLSAREARQRDARSSGSSHAIALTRRLLRGENGAGDPREGDLQPTRRSSRNRPRLRDDSAPCRADPRSRHWSGLARRRARSRRCTSRNGAATAPRSPRARTAIAELDR